MRQHIIPAWPTAHSANAAVTLAQLLATCTSNGTSTWLSAVVNSCETRLTTQQAQQLLLQGQQVMHLYAKCPAACKLSCLPRPGFFHIKNGPGYPSSAMS